uniref:Forkhead box protein O n=1 Tax=Syphacia muris TaxID=451379 RepID=A0A0N5ABF8_9BILA
MNSLITDDDETLKNEERNRCNTWPSKQLHDYCFNTSDGFQQATSSTSATASESSAGIKPSSVCSSAVEESITRATNDSSELYRVTPSAHTGSSPSISASTAATSVGVSATNTTQFVSSSSPSAASSSSPPTSSSTVVGSNYDQTHSMMPAQNSACVVGGSATSVIYVSDNNAQYCGGIVAGTTADNGGTTISGSGGGGIVAEVMNSGGGAAGGGGLDGFSGSDENVATVKLKKKRIRRKPTDSLCQKKPNPWGEESYSDLIAKALESAPDKRLKLSDIYQWFSANIPYFQERSSSEEAAGWKNSIRHNLSLHSRFMRIQNEGAGKSSWWVINPDAKPGRNPRRQRAATMESTTKAALEKKRRGARKKVLELRGADSLQSTPGSLMSSQTSVTNHELFGDNDDSLVNLEPVFRPRTQSNLSLTSRVSPSIGNSDFHEDFDFPPFVEASAMPNDILDRTNEITLSQGDTTGYHSSLNSAMMNNGTNNPQAPSQSSLMQHVKPEMQSDGAKSDLDGVQPPPSYHVLNNARNVSHSQNPLLNSNMVHRTSQPMSSYNGLYQSANHGVHWISGSIRPQNSCAQQTLGHAGLPMDLENLTLPEQPFMECDMESVIRQELSQSTSNQLTFD